MKQLILSILKYASLPLALLYGLVIFIRNKFYDLRIFTSMKFNLPVICVGNITVGGTGKSPHIEYLIELLGSKYQVATLSRGYRRRTRGFRLAKADSTASDIGDEPFQFKSKYPQVEVCVAEDRMTAVPQLLQQRPYIQTILLDDAFQHRTVRAGLSILLTDYERLYTRDYIMPFGLLREGRSASSRADLILITKCPTHLSEDEKKKLIQEINPKPNQQVFFTSIHYVLRYPLQPTLVQSDVEEVLLVTGIANPKPLQEALEKEYKKVYTLSYPDHHYFTNDDLEEIQAAFKHIQSTKKIIVTTEKDAARFMMQQEKLTTYQLPIYVQRIGIDFLFDEKEAFNEWVLNYVKSFYPEPIFEEIEDDMNQPILPNLETDNREENL
jgi:tetraacyldisaccharide 4'-kinase